MNLFKRIKCLFGKHQTARLKGVEKHPFIRYFSKETEREILFDYCCNCYHIIGRRPSNKKIDISVLFLEGEDEIK